MPDTTNPPWREQASRSLTNAGYRRGGARQAIIDLLDSQPCALSALEIEDKLRHGGRASRVVSRASIYRILDELAALSLVARIEVGQGIIRYEPLREGHGHHHHLVCDHCGTLTPFTDEKLEQAIRQLSQRVALNVSEHDIVLHGTCTRCTH